MLHQVLVSKLGELSPKAKDTNNTDANQLAKHLPQPLNDMKMEAIRTLVEQENQPKSKKRSSKITPSPAEAGQAQEV